jgi:hypothetical protein
MIIEEYTGFKDQGQSQILSTPNEKDDAKYTNVATNLISTFFSLFGLFLVFLHLGLGLDAFP